MGRFVLPRLGGRCLSALACLALAGSSPARAVTPDLRPDDVRFIVAQAQKVQKADIEAWAHYRFERLAQREDYDESGGVEGRDELEFVITPGDGLFNEDLVRHNAAPADPYEIDRYRRAAGFNKHYRTLLSGVGEETEEGGYSLGQLLHLSSYRFAGRESLNGVDCYRLDFSPEDVQPIHGGLAAKFTRAMAGSLWITVEGFHLAGARAQTVKSVSVGLLLAKIYDMSVRMEAGPVGEGVWLPQRVEVITSARVLIKSIRRHNLFVYSGFERKAPPG